MDTGCRSELWIIHHIIIRFRKSFPFPIKCCSRQPHAFITQSAAVRVTRKSKSSRQTVLLHGGPGVRLSSVMGVTAFMAGRSGIQAVSSVSSILPFTGWQPRCARASGKPSAGFHAAHGYLLHGVPSMGTTLQCDRGTFNSIRYPPLTNVSLKYNIEFLYIYNIYTDTVHTYEGINWCWLVFCSGQFPL